MLHPIQAEKLRKRYFRKPIPVMKVLAIRLGAILLVLMILAGVFWGLERDHIHDEYGNGEFSYIDSLYFTMVTVTTLGYGDIVPVTEEARMFDAFIITPIRMGVWIVFLGTAYQLVIQRYLEEFLMQREIEKLKGHVIVAGYSTTGNLAVQELLINGYDEKNLFVIDRSSENVRSAAESGATAIMGDPTSEDILEKAGIRTAGTLIITTPQDDTNVLVSLTAKDLNPSIKIISRVSYQENIKQLKRAGTDVIISPSLTGGNLMAMAVKNSSGVNLIGELLTTSRGSNLVQRDVMDDEVGRSPKSLEGFTVIGVVRGKDDLGPDALDGVELKKGDELVLLG